MNLNKVTFLWYLAIVFTGQISCTQTQNYSKDKTMISTSIIDEASIQWMSYDGVEGVAEAEKEGKPCILVLISIEPSGLTDSIPSTFKGYPVVMEKTGEIKAY